MVTIKAARSCCYARWASVSPYAKEKGVMAPSAGSPPRAHLGGSAVTSTAAGTMQASGGLSWAHAG